MKDINNYGKLLELATGKKLLAYQEFGSYQGDYIAILKSQSSIEIWKGTYGSCGLCDWLEAEKDWETSSVSKAKALEYLKDKKPYLTVIKSKLDILINSDDISSFFPANTRNNYDEWNWDDIKQMLKD